MSTIVKPVMPASKGANLRRDPNDPSRWHFDVRITRPDGTKFRRSGSAESEAEARRKRDLAFTEYNSDRGKAHEEKKRKTKERTNCFRDFAEYCVESIFPHSMAETSADAYHYNLQKHVLPEIGDLPLEEVTVQVLQDLVSKLHATGAKSAARQARSACSAVFARAVEQGKVQSNPAAAVALRDDRRRNVSDETDEERRRILSEDEINTLLATAQNTPMYMPILLGIRMGLRIAECLGLEWKHVDLTDMSLKVRQQLQWVRGKGVKPGGVKAVPPKSKSSIRTLPIPPALKTIFEDAKAEAEAIGTKWVCSKNGQPFGAKKESKYMREVVAKAGLAEPRPTHHSLRGTYLTHMANTAGVKPHVLMRLAGHADIATTMRFYVQATDGDLRAAVQDIAA